MKSKPYLITSIVFGVISLISAIILTLEEIALWKNPNYVPSCSWNPLFSCQGPMQSWQAHVFVMPNPIIGIVGFSFLIFMGIMGLLMKMPKWFWTLHAIGITLATIFIGWLISQTIYDIKALCIYCMIVWSCMIPLFWMTVSRYFLDYYPNSKLVAIERIKIPLIVASYCAVAVMIYAQFHDFFDFLLGIR